jgi:hypothetical protein
VLRPGSSNTVSTALQGLKEGIINHELEKRVAHVKSFIRYLENHKSLFELLEADVNATNQVRAIPSPVVWASPHCPLDLHPQDEYPRPQTDSGMTVSAMPFL